MKIYFDFDRTLFDTKTFLERIYSILKEYEIPLDLFDRIRLENKDDGFNLFGILEKVKEIHPFNTALYTDLERLIECDRMFLFADVEKVLEKLKKLNCKLYILTKGNERFQKAKIGNTNIANYFDDIISFNAKILYSFAFSVLQIVRYNVLLSCTSVTGVAQ